MQEGSWHRGPAARAGRWGSARRAVGSGCWPASCSQPWRRSCGGGVDPLSPALNGCAQCALPWPPAPALEYWLRAPQWSADQALWAQGRRLQTKETSGKKVQDWWRGMNIFELYKYIRVERMNMLHRHTKSVC